MNLLKKKIDKLVLQLLNKVDSATIFSGTSSEEHKYTAGTVLYNIPHPQMGYPKMVARPLLSPLLLENSTKPVSTKVDPI